MPSRLGGAREPLVPLNVTPEAVTVYRSVMDRRQFLQAGIAGGLGAAAAMHLPSLVRAGTLSPGGPFRHGVAAGDPLPDAMVIWTRVTVNDNAVPGSGIGADVTVSWQVATDDAFANAVATGSVVATAARDHTVKVDVTDLSPATTYYYRFRAQGAWSRVGRARTAPASAAANTALRFGLVSCANYEGGFFSAYRHLAARDDLDFVLHVGDYIYEYGPGSYGPGPSIGRTHDPAHEIVSLADYRRRHGQYKADPDLQALHARCAWIVTLDDHEVTNDTWSAGAENHQPASEGDFFQRRARALQAYREWMPMRAPDPADLDRIYRRLRFGTLADLHMLDLRQYRSRQVGTLLPGGIGSVEEAIDDPDRTITGTDQMTWLLDGLAAGGATWRLVGNPLMITPVLFPPLPADVARPVADLTGLYPGDGLPYNVDQWDGYQADRRRVLEYITGNGIDNVAFLTGDIHSSWACDLPLDPALYPASPSVAVELVGTSVTSDNLDELLIENGTPEPAAHAGSIAIEESIRALNRHVHLLEFRAHGYSVVNVTPARLQMDWYFLSDRTDPAATASLAYSYEVLEGSNRVRPVGSLLPA